MKTFEDIIRLVKAAGRQNFYYGQACNKEQDSLARGFKEKTEMAEARLIAAIIEVYEKAASSTDKPVPSRRSARDD